MNTYFLTAIGFRAAGMAALPKSFALLGLGFATFFLLLMGYMTHFTVEALALGTMATSMAILFV